MRVLRVAAKKKESPANFSLSLSQFFGEPVIFADEFEVPINDRQCDGSEEITRRRSGRSAIPETVKDEQANGLIEIKKIPVLTRKSANKKKPATISRIITQKSKSITNTGEFTERLVVDIKMKPVNNENTAVINQIIDKKKPKIIEKTEKLSVLAERRVTRQTLRAASVIKSQVKTVKIRKIPVRDCSKVATTSKSPAPSSRHKTKISSSRSRPGNKIGSDSSNTSDEEFKIEISSSEPESEMESLGIEYSDSEEEEFVLKSKRNRKSASTKKPTKKSKSKTKKSDVRWDRIKQILASGGTVEALPGRVDEFDWIKRTVVGLLESSLGGCLYISGVPGTGKTATTHRTLDALSLSALKGECSDFNFVEINGMRLSDPGQAYSILAKTIFKGQKRIPSSGALALQKLESHFKTQQKSKVPGKPCVVLLDELDLLLRKKQSILYHFFEWPNWTNSQLIVITIANTMDLPERFLSNRISSRLGLTRYNFKPYDHTALANIIEHQLKDYVKYLGKDAIQLCARKVSAVSGDARRAVNLAKRAVDYFRSCSQEELIMRMTGKTVEKVAQGTEMTSVNLRLMDIILKDALQANPVEIIGQLAKHQRILLLSIVLARKRLEEEMCIKGGTKIIGATNRSGILTVNRVLEQHFQLCRTHQYYPLPSLQELHCLLESLEALRLVRCVKFRESGPEAVLQLLVHEEDLRKGLGDDQALKKYIRE